ncbi:alkane hydroxylase MAH1-like [Andrographis paniculata]|uniref:alkane hydroxylase MAH1-like n=1 Tax=Andrographis paniculata TaxID=175694 RepID=UPI0021E86433|nr:alkane hydroxylase MAH1-like [Andrographis paniculata]
MAMAVALLVILPLLFLYNTRKRLGCILSDFPVARMLPGLLWNGAVIHDFLTEIIKKHGGTFYFKGPVYGNMDMMLTSDPANVNYILCKNFPNFGKGSEFNQIFEPLGDGIFAADSELWEVQKKIAKALMNHAGYQPFVAATIWRKLETGLMPILEKVSENGIEVDLQELFQRFTFDCSCTTVIGHDPVSLCDEMPHLPYEKAFEIVEETVLYRHLLPAAVWKMQKWLQFGREKKLTQAMDALHQFLSYWISDRRRQIKAHNTSMDVLTRCIKVLENDKAVVDPENIISEKVLKDLMLNLIFAGKDTISVTLTWLFWLLATNPAVEDKIRNEIAANSGEPGNWTFAGADAMNKLIYLHGAVCETLRLFPPVPIQHKVPLKDDVLPSGHPIKASTRTLMFFYSMGRMESIWGEDCLEFKPERWISEDGRIKIEPSYKFTAFNAGPRTCLGKDVSFLQVKIAAAAAISRFKFEVAEGHPIQASESVILHMKHGLKVKVLKYV